MRTDRQTDRLDEADKLIFLQLFVEKFLTGKAKLLVSASYTRCSCCTNRTEQTITLLQSHSIPFPTLGRHYRVLPDPALQFPECERPKEHIQT
jgi:hypothetical protein